MSSDSAKIILSKLDSSCGAFLETQEAKRKAIAVQKEEENKIKEETLAEEAKKPKTVKLSIDKNVFDGEKAELVCGFESNYYTCELFIDGESWAGGTGEHIIFDKPEESEQDKILNALKHQLTAKKDVFLQDERVSAMFNEFKKVAWSQRNDIKSLNPHLKEQIEYINRLNAIHKKDKYAGLTKSGDKTYFDVCIPSPYEADINGTYIWTYEMSAKTGKLEPVQKMIAHIPVLVTECLSPKKKRITSNLLL